MSVLTGIDILGIQGYVFASNRLRDVHAASWIVANVTLKDSLRQWGLQEKQVLLAAGGNAIVEFETEEAAKEWTAKYTRWLLDAAPGLEVVVAHRPCGNHSLAWGLKALAVDLARRKLERRPNAPQLGLSVTASCSITGLPATKLDPDTDQLISPMISVLRKPDTRQFAKKHWDKVLPESLPSAPGWTPAFPDELDQMGRSHGDTSLLGVVHVDGNGIGEAIKKWLDNVDDAQVRRQYGEWSDSIDKLCWDVLQAVVNRVASCIYEENKYCFIRGTPHDLGFPLRDWRDDKSGKTPKNTVWLPIRPILLGGDDLTFVCDGRIALDLAIKALREFAKHEIPHLGEDGTSQKLSACAGVALVKSHAPFHRSYELAEALCASAKQKRRHSKDSGCWLDWHIGSTRPGESLADLRKREYQDNQLTMRPYPMNAFNGRDQSWDWLDRELLGPAAKPNDSFRGFDEEKDRKGNTCQMPNRWSGSRNRVKQLGSVVTEGQGAVKRQIDAWNAIERDVQLPAGLHKGDGFIGTQTPLLDAIELLDLHLRLEPDPLDANEKKEAGR